MALAALGRLVNAGSVPPEPARRLDPLKLRQVEVADRSQATIDQLAAAMGWLPHTTRAALTGLRKRGFGIERREEKGERAGAYVIVDGPNAAQG